jgi:hypothetical protein
MTTRDHTLRAAEQAVREAEELRRAVGNAAVEPGQIVIGTRAADGAITTRVLTGPEIAAVEAAKPRER